MEIKHELIASFGMIKTGRIKNRMTASKKKSEREAITSEESYFF